MSHATMPKAYYQYLKELQAVDFVLLELALYLDTHAEDIEALEQFDQCYRRKRNILQQFESAFGPLREYGNSSPGDTWRWADAPWPWQV